MFNSRLTPSHQRSQSTPNSQRPSAAALNSDTYQDLNGNDITLSLPPTALLAYPSGDYFHPSAVASQTSHRIFEHNHNDITLETPKCRSLPLTTHRIPKDEAIQTKGLGFCFSPHSLQDIDCSGAAEHSPPPSPNKEKRSFLPSIRNDNSSNAELEVKKTTLADWFQGESAPISLGVPLSPAKEGLESIDVHEVPKPSNIERQMSSIPTRPPALGTSRFSFFSPKSKPPALPQIFEPHDEFSNLDIKTSLLPGGQADPFSPSSFKNLLQNAEALLSRMQAAYKQRVMSIQEITMEKEAQKEEMEEAHIRAKHLKSQLDDMTARMAEQDAVIMNLVDDLAQQKQWRSNEEAKKSIRMVGADDDTYCQCHHHRRSKKRNSKANTVSDSGFESESDDDSIFSQAQDISSPTISSISTPSTASPDLYFDRDLSRNGNRRLPSLRAMPLDGRLLDQKYHKQIGPLQPGFNGMATCGHCAAMQSSEAWGVADMMKMENNMLKERVEQLEGSLDGCLDLIRGLGV